MIVENDYLRLFSGQLSPSHSTLRVLSEARKVNFILRTKLPNRMTLLSNTLYLPEDFSLKLVNRIAGSRSIMNRY